jgi:hypothetical protein
MFDKKAQKILFDTFWSPTGWKNHPTISEEDLKYAKSAGYMFDKIDVNHNYIIDWLGKSVNSVELSMVTNAFLVSLSSRQLHLRSALGSYAVALHLQKHEFTGDIFCNLCGQTNTSSIDLNILNFERYKWGGVRHTSPDYIAFDLDMFRLLEIGSPTQEDIAIIIKIIEAIQQSDESTTPNHLEKKISKLLKSNKEERKVLLEILSYCGILSPLNRPCFFDEFVPYNQRYLPDFHKIDWTYPICWWRGSDGVNQEALRYFFPIIYNRLVWN